MSVSSGLHRTQEQAKLTFHWVYEAKVREEALEEKVQREKKHRAEIFDDFEHLHPAIPHGGKGVIIFQLD